MPFLFFALYLSKIVMGKSTLVKTEVAQRFSLGNQ